MTLLLLLAQAIAGPVLPAAPRPHRDAPCPVGTDPDEVVVCARDQDGYRLHSLPGPQQREGLPKAEIALGNTKFAVEGEQASDGHGGAVNRAMLRLKIPLGAKRKRDNP